MTDQTNQVDLTQVTQDMRCAIITMTNAAGSGHPGGSLSATDIVATLYFGGIMDYDPQDLTLPTRDRFILSKGHAAPVLYAALWKLGVVEDNELRTLRHLGSRLQGHPDMTLLPGVEVSTGSLGQGLSVSSGMALGLKRRHAQEASVPHVFVMLGDGELQEGQNWEAAMFAAHFELDNLVAIVDYNDLQIDGQVHEIMSLGEIGSKFEAFGWRVFSIDGHDLEEIHDTLIKAKEHRGSPAVIIAKTVKGKGVSFMENVCDWHGKAPNDEQSAAALDELHAAISLRVGE